MTTLADRKQIKPIFRYDVVYCDNRPNCPGRQAYRYQLGHWNWDDRQAVLVKAGWVEIGGKRYCCGRLCDGDAKRLFLAEKQAETAIRLGEKDHE